MRTQGKITSWNDVKGYGFITPASGAKQVFFHIRAFRGNGERPQAGQRVSFALSTDREGRPCAVRVALAGDAVADEIKPNDRILMIAGAVLFLGFLGVLAWSGTLPSEIFALYLGLSVFTFAAYAIDKSSAESGVSRIAENKLHLFALIGGWPGAMVAQQILRHKSRKASFRSVFWITVVVNCAFLGWLCTPWGESLLKYVSVES